MTGVVTESPFRQLLDVLDLNAYGEDRFVARSMELGWKRIYGGQVIAQALIAATRTVASDRPVHSLHAYFLRPGNPEVPIVLEVDRLRDGGSFTARHVKASQNGQAILTLSASFKTQENGLSHAEPKVHAPEPEDLPSIPELMEGKLSFLPDNVKDYWLKRRPMELRPISLEHYISRTPLPAKQNIWLRAVTDETFDHAKFEPGLAAAITAYLSDMTLLDTSLFAHGRSIFDRDLQVASVDHAMWFHTVPNMQHLADWLFYQQSSPAADRGCGFAQGGIYTRDGARIASVAQEGLIRVRS